MEVSDLGVMNSMMSSMPPINPPSASDIGSKTIEDKDTNGGGVLSADELGVSDETFSQIDTDGDGSVSQSEMVDKVSEQLGLIEENGEKPDINEVKSKLAEIGVDMPEGPPAPPESQTGAGAISQALDQTELTEEEKGVLMQTMSTQTLDASA